VGSFFKDSGIESPMNPLTIEEFYKQSIGVTAPWKVAKVFICGESRQVQITVECPQGLVWADPETEERAELKDWVERQWRHLDTCEFETVIIARVPRVKLKSGRTIMVTVPWAEPNGRFTLGFENRLIDFLRDCKTIKGAARLGHVTVDQMDGVMARAVQRGLLRRIDKPLKYIGLDEKSFRKGHRYATVLCNLGGEGEVLDVIEDRTQEATEKLLKTLSKESRETIEAVAMDMWPAYSQAAAIVLPKSVEVFDRFHISKHLNEAVDKVRRGEHRELTKSGDDTLKRTKYLWLRGRLDLRTKDGIKFRALLNNDLDTATAWALKENFRRFWSHITWSRACSFLDRWVQAAHDSGLKPMARVADMIENHADGLLNYIHHNITNGALEGINSTIQSLKHSARGLPNFKAFRIRILFFLGKLNLRPA
jgi:transposase